METALAAIVGLFFAAAIYLMLSKHIIRMLLGIALFGNAVNLLIFTAGRVASEVAPVIPERLIVAPPVWLCQVTTRILRSSEHDWDKHTVLLLRIKSLGIDVGAASAGGW